MTFTVTYTHIHVQIQGVALYGSVALNSADFATVALNSALFIHLSIHPRYVLISVAWNSAFFSSVRPSTVHNSQHVWLMFDIESQLFLSHGQGCGLDSNDGGSLESGPGSRLAGCGYRQEALLERGLGAEGHQQSAQRCISADQEEELQDHGDSIQYYDGFRGHVIEVHEQSSPGHEAQEEIRKEDALFASTPSLDAVCVLCSLAMIKVLSPTCARGTRMWSLCFWISVAPLRMLKWSGHSTLNRQRDLLLITETTLADYFVICTTFEMRVSISSGGLRKCPLKGDAERGLLVLPVYIQVHFSKATHSVSVLASQWRRSHCWNARGSPRDDRANQLQSSRSEELVDPDMTTWNPSPCSSAWSVGKTHWFVPAHSAPICSQLDPCSNIDVPKKKETDVAWCPLTERLTSGLLAQFGPHLWLTSCTTQVPVSLSRGEAEMYELTKARSRALGVKNLACDSVSCVERHPAARMSFSAVLHCAVARIPVLILFFRSTSQVDASLSDGRWSDRDVRPCVSWWSHWCTIHIVHRYKHSFISLVSASHTKDITYPFSQSDNMYDAVLQLIAHRVVRQENLRMCITRTYMVNLAKMLEEHALQVMSPTSV